MAQHYVITVVGTDRIGLVDHVTDLVLKSDCNIGTSRMARLGSEFAIMLHVTSPHEEPENLRQNLTSLEEDGLILNIVETDPFEATQYSGWVPYQIKVFGADHEGVVHDISRYLAKHRINIETMETSIVASPMSGTPLFTIDATVIVPPDISFSEFSKGLEEVGDDLNMDTEVSPYRG